MGYSLDLSYSDDITLLSESKACDPLTDGCEGGSGNLHFGFSVHYIVHTLQVTPAVGTPYALPAHQGVIGRDPTGVVRLGVYTDSHFDPSGSSDGPINGSVSIGIPISEAGDFTLDEQFQTDSFVFDCDIDRDGDVDNDDLLMFVSLLGTSIGDGVYNPRADFNLDGSVDAADGLLMRSLLTTVAPGLLYGDVISTSAVDCADAIAAAGSWGHSYSELTSSYPVELDYNLDGILDATDKAHFDSICSCTQNAASCGQGWVGGANPPTTSSVVRAVIAWDPDPNLNGTSPKLPTIAYSNGSSSTVAYWTGAAWTTLASSITGTVDVLGVDSNGQLIAGGSFSSIGGVSASNIAYYAAGAWHAMGTGTNGRVRALYPNPLAVGMVVGGEFSTAGGSTVNHLANWDGSSWSALGTGTNDNVYALCEDSNGFLVAGGNFTQAGGSSIGRGLAGWDGSSWSALGAGINTGSVNALAVLANGSMIAGGSFTSVDSVSSTSHIAKWDGSSWSALGSGLDGTVNALATLPSSKFVAGGSFSATGTASLQRVARWTGSAWNSMGSGIAGASSDVLGLAMLPTAASANAIQEIIAGGVFSIAGPTSAQNFGRWSDTGKAWIAVQPVAGLHAAANDTVTLSATAAAGYDYAGALTYTWKHSTTTVNNGANGASSPGGTVSGATSSSMTITTITASDLGTYTVIIANSCGSVTSIASHLGATCSADFNLDGVVAVQDIFDFLTAWFAADSRADWNGVDGITVQDVFDFLSSWFAGCS